MEFLEIHVFPMLFASTLKLTLAIFCAVLVIFFLFHVVARGIVLWFRLWWVERGIRRIPKDDQSAVKSRLQAIFKRTRWLRLWEELEETLHEQRVLMQGELVVASVRTTVPAVAFFNNESIVDGRVHAEFYKHVPGILTGIGIIATFYGLIQGLISFDAGAVDPEALRESLQGLFLHVKEAFLFSAAAIGLAMLVTLLEKGVYAACISRVSKLTEALDSLFRSGVGEEYLADLVRSSQEGAAQTRQLKESLVEDLKALLTNLTERQIEATQQISVDISRNLQENLEGPLKQIAETVRMASGQQSDTAAQVLENLMVSFITQMKESLGGQIGDLSGLMQQTAGSLQQVESSIRQLVADIAQSSSQSSLGVERAMSELMQALQSHQREQAEAVSNSSASIFKEMQTALEKIALAQADSLRLAQEATSGAATAIGQAASTVLSASRESLDRSGDLITRFTDASTANINSLDQGAARIVGATEHLATTVENLDLLTEKLTGLQSESISAADRLVKAGTTISAITQSLSSAMNALVGVSSKLDETALALANDARIRESSMAIVEQAMRKAESASQLFAQLTQEIEDTLVQTVERFGTSVGTALDKHLSSFDKQLADAAALLASSMQELAVIAESMSEVNRGK